MKLVDGVRKRWIHMLFALLLVAGGLLASPVSSVMAGSCGKPKCGNPGGPSWRCSVSIDGLAITLQGDDTDGQCGF